MTQQPALWREVVWGVCVRGARPAFCFPSEIIIIIKINRAAVRWWWGGFLNFADEARLGIWPLGWFR